MVGIGCSPAAGPRQTKLICFSGLRWGEMTKVGSWKPWLEGAGAHFSERVRVRLMLIMCCYQFPISWQN